MEVNEVMRIMLIVFMLLSLGAIPLAIHIDGLKFKLRNAQDDAKMWRKLHDLEKDLRLKLDELRK